MIKNSTVFTLFVEYMRSMKELVDHFPQQLREAMEISRKAILSPFPGTIRNVIISGLGGSGIGGSIISEVTRNECPVPVFVNKDYSCPAFAGPDTLFIVSSYSGNTEETLSALAKAEEKGVKPVIITSGGKLALLAAEKGYDIITIPAGMPPRSCLGYSLCQLFHIFNRYGLINDDYKKQWELSADRLERESELINETAHRFTETVLNTNPVIYSETPFEALSVRICQQLSENSKMLCSNRVIPEMNHNELVGWREPQQNTSVVFIKTGLEFYRNQARFDYTKKVISHYCNRIFELEGKGESALEQILYIIHITDIASCILAEKRGYDASEIDVIITLKDFLANMN